MKNFLFIKIKTVSIVLLFIISSCNKMHEDLEQENDSLPTLKTSGSDFNLIAEKIGFEYENMVSFSLNQLLDYGTILNDPLMQKEIVEEGVDQWIIDNGYFNDGRSYFDSTMVLFEGRDLSDMISRSSGIFNNYTNAQFAIVEDIINVAKISSFDNFSRNIESVEDAISILPKQDQLELLIMIEILKGTFVAITDFHTLTIKNGFAYGFICNLTAGGIGAIYGGWAGGIAAGVFAASGIATGGITIAVGLVAGAAISTIVCK